MTPNSPESPSSPNSPSVAKTPAGGESNVENTESPPASPDKSRVGSAFKIEPADAAEKTNENKSQTADNQEVLSEQQKKEQEILAKHKKEINLVFPRTRRF
jgi:hypothetical protein